MYACSMEVVYVSWVMCGFIRGIVSCLVMDLLFFVLDDGIFCGSVFYCLVLYRVCVKLVAWYVIGSVIGFGCLRCLVSGAIVLCA